MNISFRISKGDQPALAYVLEDDNGPVDLTGGSVEFTFQGGGVSFVRAATVVNAAGGAVEYQMVAGDTAIPGLYQGQWIFTRDGTKQTFPTGSANGDDASGEYINFEIVETIPVSTPDGVTRLADCAEPVRAILGDFKRRRYEEQAILSVLRSVVKLGHVSNYSITADNRFITPAIRNPQDLALLVYHSAKIMVMPNAAAYSYRLRSMSESFGKQEHFIFDLENKIAEAQGGRVFHTFQTFYDWIGATAGVDIWSMLTDLRVNGPVARVTIGSDGVRVN